MHQNESPNTCSSSGASRRAALKNIAAGAGVIAGSQALPERWLKPVVSSIVMPVHAQTSPSSAFEGCQISEGSLVRNAEGTFSETRYSFEVQTEATDGTTVDLIVRDPGTDPFNSQEGGVESSDFVDTAIVDEGRVTFSGDIATNTEATPIDVDVDFEQDGDIDCSDSIDTVFADED